MGPRLLEFDQAAADARFRVGQHGHRHAGEAGIDREFRRKYLFVELHRTFELGSRDFNLKTSPQRREDAKIAKETTGRTYLTTHPVGGTEDACGLLTAWCQQS